MIRRQFFALVATGLLGVAALVGINPARADAAPCNLSPQTGAPGSTNYPVRVVFANHQSCAVVWVEGNLTASGTYRFRAYIMDMVDPSTNFDAGRANLQWSTPCGGGCLNPWTTKVHDTNSVDWVPNDSIGAGTVWISPSFNVITNGMPGQFRWRILNTTVSVPTAPSDISGVFRIGPE